MERKNNRTILILVMFITFLSILGIWGFSAFYLLKARELVLSQQKKSLESFARIVAEQTGSIFAGSTTYLKVVSAWLHNNPDKDPRTDPDFRRAEEVFQSEYGHSIHIRFVSTDGKLYYTGDKPGKGRADVSDRDYYLAQKDPRTRGLFFAKAVKSRVTNLWGIPVSLPLEPNRYNLELMFAAIELPLIVDSWDKSLPAKTAIINLIRSDGILLATSPFIEDREGVSLASGEVWRKYLPENASGSAVLLQPLLSDSARLVAWKRLDKYPAVISVSMSLDEIYVNWNRQVRRAFVVLTAISLLLVSLVVQLIRLFGKERVNELQLQELVTRDALTGLFNRRYVIEYLVGEFERSKRHKRPLSCLMLDIDHFKQCNDTFGHAYGDEILKAFASVLELNTRRQDVAGRYGGEEFLLVMAETDKNEALVVAEKLREKTGEIIKKDGIPLTVSIGVAVLDGGHPSPDALINAADQAMYRAKEGGRNRTEMAQEMRQKGF